MHAFSTIALSALLTAFVNAAPLNKRDVVWVTETDIDIVTVPVTKTVWVDWPGTTEQAAVEDHHSASSPAVSEATSTTSVYTTPAAPATTSSTSVYVAPTSESTTSVSVAPTTSSTSAYVAPTTSTYVAPTTSASVAPTTSAYVAPTTSAYVAPTEATTSAYVASTTSSSVAAATSSASSSSLNSGSDASGASYEGDFTWYAVGLGACGYNNVASDHVVAVSEDLFDLFTPNGNPNNNPLCGKTLNVIGVDGSTYQAEIVDRCVGCAMGALDFSEDFFNTVTSNGNGRVHNMKWSFA